MNNIQQKPLRFLSIKEVIDRVKLSKATIYNRIATGEFPRQISLGGKRVAWLEADIDGWITHQALLGRRKVA
ncbi:helix-turn-helix transcriptional regulator [Aliidiomarina maris]|uniref:AlpA family transcriptional regulator n=1 Tax=Aliidiomarina maris TaxID=531312 RepID=A0A327X6Y2_9GAMM|nr:AlpA family phage regulatory protein [Aliidiomarina maris]RAK01653.1 AlpA family transcriptional regulator [Aliidiomarina maris]RUO28477.1 AlpA family transcriptional regulator [Aliidiomarina maris]